VFDFHRKSFVFVTCAGGAQPMLEREIRALGLRPEAARPLGVALRASLDDCLRLNLHLRTAHRVLWEVLRTKAENADQLYEAVTALPWEQAMPADGYLTVVSSVDNPTIRDARFANQRVKDAVVDRILAARGRRPDSGPDRRGTVLSLHWQGRSVSLSLDTSGEPLSNRGYRTMPHSAPMRETLAAACLLAAGYDGRGHLVNPMCGSGTLALEAALLATGTAPGLLRENFAFLHLPGFDPARWQALRDEARGRARPTARGRIVATDHDPQALAAARHNAAAAGLEALVELDTCDFRETAVPEALRRAANVLIVNPEYGLRLGDEEALKPLHAALGDFLKQRCQGYVGAVFTGNPRLAAHIGLRTRARLALMNGPIECRLLLYDLYAGSRRHQDE
jgi:putative N6-adenine-specific DNA methylase